MNKDYIKAKWGKYTDTDKLVDDMMSLLTKYNHRNTEHGVCCVLDKFFTNKESLINLLQKSEHYTGDLRIVLDEELERRCDENRLYACVDTFPYKIKAYEYIKQKTDSHGKTMGDYLKIGRQKISIDDLESEELTSVLSVRNDALATFTSDGYTIASEQEYTKFIKALNCFKHITSSTMSEFDECLAEYKIREGMKTSRAFNKICHHFKVDNTPLYNKEFAKYADMVSERKQKIKFFISVNPLDYLTMSFGVNWASCHTIDRYNRRGMPNSYSGGYCGGTMSYMLDSTSVITYVHNEMPENYETGKVYRNMFHMSESGILLQGRVYPQGNDGCTDLYKEFRFIMQKELTTILGLERNKWTKRNYITNVESLGDHYRDYTSFGDCNMSYPTERPECTIEVLIVGSDRICTYCGESAERLSSSQLSHSGCNI